MSTEMGNLNRLHLLFATIKSCLAPLKVPVGQSIFPLIFLDWIIYKQLLLSDKFFEAR